MTSEGVSSGLKNWPGVSSSQKHVADSVPVRRMACAAGPGHLDTQNLLVLAGSPVVSKARLGLRKSSEGSS